MSIVLPLHLRLLALIYEGANLMEMARIAIAGSLGPETFLPSS